jgi:signal transduction histidine kinase
MSSIEMKNVSLMFIFNQNIKSTLGLMIGFGVILLALVSFVMQMNLADLFVWLEKIFSWSFIFCYSLLLVIGIYAGVKVKTVTNKEYWYEVGSQVSNGIATLALTFTLLGISLGIGSLGQQSLTPNSVHLVIGELTSHFSTAFMTTVIGLPTANLIRAWVSLRAIPNEAD